MSKRIDRQRGIADNPVPLACWFVLTFAVAAAQGETLRQLLAASRIPFASFNEAELSQPVQGAFKNDDRQVVLAYRRLKGEFFYGHPLLARYDKSNGAVLRAELSIDDSELCAGSPGDLDFIGEFASLGIGVSPSAECLFVFDQHLKLRQTLYGFNPVEIAPAQVVLIENLIHFAPVHPERLQFADLNTGEISELYPPKGDPLRAEFAIENKKHMPPPDTCARVDDPCDPKQFDEDIESLTTNGKGEFAFLASQYADHQTEGEDSPETVAAQLVLYVYRRDRETWRYCEEKIDDSKKSLVESLLKTDYAKTALRCKPTVLVVPDLTTADYNPFLKR